MLFVYTSTYFKTNDKFIYIHIYLKIFTKWMNKRLILLVIEHLMIWNEMKLIGKI